MGPLSPTVPREDGQGEAAEECRTWRQGESTRIKAKWASRRPSTMLGARGAHLSRSAPKRASLAASGAQHPASRNSATTGRAVAQLPTKIQSPACRNVARAPATSSLSRIRARTHSLLALRTHMHTNHRAHANTPKIPDRQKQTRTLHPPTRAKKAALGESNLHISGPKLVLGKSGISPSFLSVGFPHEGSWTTHENAGHSRQGVALGSQRVLFRPPGVRTASGGKIAHVAGQKLHGV